LVRFLRTGSTLGSVNFPEIEIRTSARKNEVKVRVINVHKNVPGVLRQINKIVSDFNIEKEICASKGSIGYLMVDIDTNNQEEILSMYQKLKDIPENLMTRVIL
jgi:D-3-phosphoglycerate dehydrogenase